MTRNKILSAVTHFIPVFLSLACLTISVLGFSVYDGFSDGELGTYLSLVIMFACFVISILGALKKDITRFMFWLAITISLVIFFAMLDEYFEIHERFGKYLQREVPLFSERKMAFIDDIIILLGAIVASVVFYFVVKRTRNDSLLRQLLWSIVITAIGHGVLDILSHKVYLWGFFLPDISSYAAYELTEQLGCFEEWMKIWCEWFVLLFLFRLFHKHENHVIWSIQIIVATILACAGLWAINPETQFIPYLILWPTDLGIIRNHHILGAIICIWLTWGLITYRLFNDNSDKLERAGWFWICPLPFLLLTDNNAQIFAVAFGLISGIFFGKNLQRSIIILIIVMLSAFIDSHILVRLSFVLGFAVASFIIHGYIRLIIGILLVVVPFWIVVNGVHIDLFSIMIAVGLLLPFALYALERNLRKSLIPVSILFIALILTSDPSIIFLIWVMSITIWASIPYGQTVCGYRRLTFAIAIAHLLLVLVLISMGWPEFIPNDRYDYLNSEHLQ